MSLVDWVGFAVDVVVVWAVVVWVVAVVAVVAWFVRRAPRTSIEEHERPVDDWPWR